MARINGFAPSVVVALVALSLLVTAQPLAAEPAQLDGPEEVDRTDPVEFTLTIDDGGGESVESYAFVLAPGDGESDERVEVTFAPDGRILETTPNRGVVGEGEIKVALLKRTLRIERLESDTGYGYGYGYGYGDGGSAAFAIELGSEALKHGEYTARVSANAGSETDAFTSSAATFTVTRPARDDSEAKRGKAKRGEAPEASGEPEGPEEPADERRHPLERKSVYGDASDSEGERNDNSGSPSELDSGEDHADGGVVEFLRKHILLRSPASSFDWK